MEGSAKTGEEVEGAFQRLTNTVIYKIDSGELPEEVVSTDKVSRKNHDSNVLGDTNDDNKAALGGSCIGASYCSIF